MTDFFAVLGVPRRPWLDAGALKERFHELAALHHPDVAAEDRVDFSQLNAAFQTLRDPALRLRHFLELEQPGLLLRQSQVPAPLADLFMEIGATRAATDRWHERRAAATTGLSQALLARERLALLEQTERHLASTEEQHRAALAAAESLDYASADGPRDYPALRRIYEMLAYTAKWRDLLTDAARRLKTDTQ